VELKNEGAINGENGDKLAAPVKWTRLLVTKTDDNNIDRQTDTQTHRQTDRRTDRQTIQICTTRTPRVMR